MEAKTTHKKSKLLPVVIAVCATILLLAGIGAVVYMHQQDIAQKDRALQQEAKNKEYEQQQINDRANQQRSAEGMRCAIYGC